MDTLKLEQASYLFPLVSKMKKKATKQKENLIIESTANQSSFNKDEENIKR